MNFWINQRWTRSRALRLCLPLVGAIVTLNCAAKVSEVPNFSLLDLSGKNWELRRTEGRAVVLFFSGVGCPIARKSAPKLDALAKKFEDQGICFCIVNSDPDDSSDEIRKELNELHIGGFTCLVDPRQALALALDVKRTAEVVALRLSDRHIIYRGAIDDQFSEGSELPEPRHAYLDDALTAFLADRSVAVEETPPHGCRLGFAKIDEEKDGPSYSHVARILRQHCVDCHRRGDIGQWSMDSYGRVRNKAAMISEVLLERRMPPWDPDPNHGQFIGQNRLSREELQVLLRWSMAGAPRGEGPDPLATPLEPVPEWEFGTPDVVLRAGMQTVPATGVLDYRTLPLEFKRDKELWISGIEIKPGNRKVVHHAVLYAKWPGCNDNGDTNGVYLLAWAPGVPPMRLPEGVGKRLPVNASLSIQMHYTVCGSEQTDTTSAALRFWPGPQTRAVETREAIEWDLNLPPGSDEIRHAATYGFKTPATIYSVFPHMHVRGSAMRYELLLPDGTKETLLNVPRYDFNWQYVYALTEPRRVPAGAWLLVTGSFDNSVAKPGNPDPKKRVHFGAQSWDEMFIGFFEAAEDPADHLSAAR
jgi:peroxiredoxin